MATNRNEKLAQLAHATPARYNRAFARSRWFNAFGDNITFKMTRQAQRENSFRHFAGRTKGL